ncbi:MAG: prepilin-type N-terminal cleavage/methylation domain-containing protein [Phycisphaerae bacterium]|nr:prepilin-type N-terminal cleavage/methylation domain-containing protein [Phycisphaerae bacterium]
MKKRGFTLAELLVTIAVITLLMLILLPVLKRARDNRIRAACANNLRQIGFAMLIYCSDYNDDLPCAAGPNARWTGRVADWRAKTRAEAYALDANTPGVSISASFYLLVKYESFCQKISDDPYMSFFVCPADAGTTPFEFDPAKFDTSSDTDLGDLWDFGPDPSQHVSYAYHIPYGQYPLTSSGNPGMAVAADRNPWLDFPGYNARPPSDLAAFDPGGAGKTLKQANSLIHQQDGQNVVYLDGHVAFEANPDCGLKNDNIYTSHNGADIQKGTPPTLESQPADPNDSLLVHDPPLTSRK